MKTKVKMADDLPAECPKCESDDLCICNDDGMECMRCGCWFNAEDDGSLIWAYGSHPVSID